MKFGIGQPVRRYEDLRLITGQGRYTDDIELPQIGAGLCAALAGRARATSGVSMPPRRGTCPACCWCATGDDVKADGLGDVACHDAAQQPRRHAAARHAASGAGDRQGPPCRPAGRAWSSPRPWPRRATPPRRSRSTTRQLPAVTDAKDALAPGAPQLFDHIPGNLVFDWDNDTRRRRRRPTRPSPRPRTSSRSSSSTTASWRTRWSRATPIGDYDPASGRSTLYTGDARSAFRARPARRNGAQDSEGASCALITPNVGGGFGMKAFVYPEQALVVWASRKLKRPVKWQEDRSEGFISDNQGRDHATRAELALDARGPLPRLARLDHRQSRRLSLAVRLLHSDALDRSRLRPLLDRRRSTSTSRACAPTRCRSALIAAPGGPRPPICSSGSSTRRRANSA